MGMDKHRYKGTLVHWNIGTGKHIYKGPKVQGNTANVGKRKTLF